MKKIMTLGGATKDVFINCQQTSSFKAHKDTQNRCFMLVEEGAKIEVTDLHYASGGGATNSSASFKRLGFDVSSFFQVGDDEAGNFIINELHNEHIDISIIAKTSLYNTGISFIFPSATNNRAIFAYRGANAELQEHQIPFNVFKNYEGIYVTSLSGNSSKLLPSIAKQAKRDGLMVATNPGTSQLTVNPQDMMAALSCIDVFILNLKESQTFLKMLQTQKNVCKKGFLPKQSRKNSDLYHRIQKISAYFPIMDYFCTILHQGPSIVIVTNGAEGVYAATNNTLYFHPSLPVKITNTVGAGDAFGSCFVASIWQGKPIEQAIIHGIINSASVICHKDAKQGLLSSAQIKNYAQKLGTKNVQSIDFN